MDLGSGTLPLATIQTLLPSHYGSMEEYAFRPNCLLLLLTDNPAWIFIDDWSFPRERAMPYYQRFFDCCQQSFLMEY